MAVVALVATPGRAAEVADVVALVGRGHRVVSWHHHVRPGRGRRPGAVVAADVEALEVLGSSAAEIGVPVVCRVIDQLDETRARSWGVTATFCLVDGPGVPGPTTKDVAAPIRVPRRGVDTRALAVIPLLTRSQLRSAHGLPDPLVLAVDPSASPADRSTGLALASAAVVSEDLVPLALALGTPSVVTPEVADRMGLEDGNQVAVEGLGIDSDRRAARLARDQPAAASMARRARRFAEDHLDLARPVEQLQRALGLIPAPSVIERRLAELSTPPSSRLNRRAAEAMTLFTLEAHT